MPTPYSKSANAPDISRSLRTEWNVRDSDGTLIIIVDGEIQDSGTQWAARCADNLSKPKHIVNIDTPIDLENIREWIALNKISVMNVAGPSESSSNGIGEITYSLLKTLMLNK